MCSALERVEDGCLLLDDSAFGTSTPVGLANSGQSHISPRLFPFPAPVQSDSYISALVILVHCGQIATHTSIANWDDIFGFGILIPYAVIWERPFWRQK